MKESRHEQGARDASLPHLRRLAAHRWMANEVVLHGLTDKGSPNEAGSAALRQLCLQARLERGEMSSHESSAEKREDVEQGR